ncbi:MAG TPA: serine/threonine-protein kinase [Vicinamibacteria bacterium]|nr:serine/threonine-protein kinase [Vicinamibacteria bacterium]
MTIRTLSRYQLLEEIGRGNMGVVYRARDPVMDRTVAIKVIRLGFSLDDSKRHFFLERFHREAQIAGKLGHPHIVAVHDFGTGDEPYIVMEYFPGVSLSALAERGPLPLEDVELVARQLGVALAYAHEQGVVHRDIKPANVLYQRGCVKLLDFGIAKLETSDLTATGEFLGTPSYMPPESFAGGPADGRSDLFSLGVVLYQILTGRKPFEGGTLSRTIYRVLHEDPKPPSSLRPGIPPGWDRVLGRLLAKIPDARYATAGEFLHALDGLAEREVASSRKTTRVSLLLAALALVLVFAVPAPVQKPESSLAPAPASPAPSLPLQFVARHEHRIGHCTGDLSLAENGLVFVAPRHGEWRFPPERIESLAFRSETELELRARAHEESETFRFTFLRPALERNRFREYQVRVLARGRE